MTVKAQLKVQLLANDVVIAESESSALWQAILRAIEGGEPLQPPEMSRPAPAEVKNPSVSPPPARESDTGADSVAMFANDLRLSRAVVEGACGPSADAPYIHLDRHCWESLRRNTAERGPTAVP